MFLLRRLSLPTRAAICTRLQRRGRLPLLRILAGGSLTRCLPVYISGLSGTLSAVPCSAERPTIVQGSAVAESDSLMPAWSASVRHFPESDCPSPDPLRVRWFFPYPSPQLPQPVPGQPVAQPLHRDSHPASASETEQASSALPRFSQWPATALRAQST